LLQTPRHESKLPGWALRSELILIPGPNLAGGVIAALEQVIASIKKEGLFVGLEKEQRAILEKVEGNFQWTLETSSRIDPGAASIQSNQSGLRRKTVACWPLQPS
jgi:hypothetical protein